MDKRKLLWGDLHKHLQETDKVDAILKDASNHLDFYCLLCYPFIWFLQDKSGKTPVGQPSHLHNIFPDLEKGNRLLVESVGHRDEFDGWWQLIRSAARKHHRPGEFVTLLGYEWHGNRKKYGDHNVIYFDLEGTLDPEPELPALYNKLRGKKALVIPHHMGYNRYNRGKNWDIWDDRLSPVAEIYSSHGCSEKDPSIRSLTVNTAMGPGSTQTSWQNALDRGYRVGAIASNDGAGLPGSWDKGLAAVWAKSLSRDGLREAIQERRTYAVTGDRIKLSFHINGAPMGSLVNHKNSATATFNVVCPDMLDRVELIKNGYRVACYCHPDIPPPTTGEVICNLRVDFGWGPATYYGLSEGVFKWEGKLKVKGGDLLDVKPCFSNLGQKVEYSNTSAYWKFRIQRRSGREKRVNESLIFKIKGTPKTQLELKGEGYELTRTIEQVMSDSEVIPFEKKAISTIKEELDLKPSDVINPDIYYFNAPKIKIHKAAFEKQCQAKGRFEISGLKEGRNYLYLRVLEMNGQMAWSSPIWIDR